MAKIQMDNHIKADSVPTAQTIEYNCGVTVAAAATFVSWKLHFSLELVAVITVRGKLDTVKQFFQS